MKINLFGVDVTFTRDGIVTEFSDLIVAQTEFSEDDASIIAIAIRGLIDIFSVNLENGAGDDFTIDSLRLEPREGFASFVNTEPQLTIQVVEQSFQVNLNPDGPFGAFATEPGFSALKQVEVINENYVVVIFENANVEYTRAEIWYREDSGLGTISDLGAALEDAGADFGDRLTFELVNRGFIFDGAQYRVDTENSWLQPFENVFGSVSFNEDAVEGTEEADTMIVGYTDDDGDAITDGDDIIYALGGDDVIYTGNSADKVFVGAGNDTVYAGRGSKTIYGEAGNDYIAVIDDSEVDGGTGNDHLYSNLNKGRDHIFTGGAGADLFEFNYAGSREADQIITDFEVGTDTLRINDQTVSGIDIADLPVDFTTSSAGDGSLIIEYGGIHSVTVNGVTEAEFFIPVNTPPVGVDGTEGDDNMIVGFTDADGDQITEGYDVILALGGNDTIRTGNGDDLVYSGDGNDNVYAGRGSKTIYGEAGDDYITVIDGSIVDGGDGNDHLYSNLSKGGDHTFTGGAGSDLFEFNYAGSKEANQIITDFEVGIDSLKVNGQSLSGIALSDLPSEFSTGVASDGSLIIEYGGIHSITLSGLTEAEFFI